MTAGNRSSGGIATRVRACAAALAGASIVLTVAPAMAQPPGVYHVGPAITVYGPQYVRQPTTGRRVRLDKLSLAVPIGDLDLSTPYGARVAKARIERAALRVCEDVKTAYPFDVGSPDGCYGPALRGGLLAAQRVAGYPIVAWEAR